METDSREKTLRMAANVLEYRHRSSRALYQRLLEKGAEEQDAAYAVSRLQQMGFLNDGEYGKLLVRDLCRRGYGPSRIHQYLKEKHPRGNKLGNTTLHKLCFAKFWVFQLVTDSHTITCTHQFWQIIIQSMKWETSHMNSIFSPFPAHSKCDT